VRNGRRRRDGNGHEHSPIPGIGRIVMNDKTLCGEATSKRAARQQEGHKSDHGSLRRLFRIEFMYNDLIS
jgi:hypothetical protein